MPDLNEANTRANLDRAVQGFDRDAGNFSAAMSSLRSTGMPGKRAGNPQLAGCCTSSSYQIFHSLVVMGSWVFLVVGEGAPDASSSPVVPSTTEGVIGGGVGV